MLHLTAGFLIHVLTLTVSLSSILQVLYIMPTIAIHCICSLAFSEYFKPVPSTFSLIIQIFSVKRRGPWGGSSVLTVGIQSRRGQEAKLLMEVDLCRERLSKCLLIIWRMSDSEFWGKEITYPSILYWLVEEFSRFLWGGLPSVASSREIHTWEACLPFPLLSSCWAFQRGTGSSCWWPGPELCGKEYSSAQTFQSLLKPNGTSLSPGPHPLPPSVCCFSIATKYPSFMFPLLAPLQSAPSPTPLL